MPTVARLLVLSALVLVPWSTARAVPSCPGDVAAAWAAACPCAGIPVAGGGTTPWRNHGQYVSCVTHFRVTLKKAGCSAAASAVDLSCAAQSTCGSNKGVVCCTTVRGTCSDPAPGDGIKAGKCSNAPKTACNSATDCTRTRAGLLADAATCTAAGGTSLGAGSVCTTCPAAP